MKTLLIILSAIIISGTVKSQNDTANISTTTVYFGKQKSAKTDKSNKNHNHTIKFSISDLFFGKGGIYFETKLFKNTSIEIGGGITFNNLIGNKLRESPIYDNDNQESDYFNESLDILDDDYNFDSREAEIGYFFGLMPRFYYWKENGLYGPYVALNFQIRQYNYEAYTINPNTAFVGTINYLENGPTISEFEKTTIGALTWGIQRMPYRFLIDFNCSLGVMNLTSEKRDNGYVVAGLNDDNFIATSAPVNRKKDYLTVYIECNFKIGFGL